MQSGMFTIFGTTYYTHGLGLIFVFPFAVWFLITVEKCSANYFLKRKPIGLNTMVLPASISLLVFAGVFLDVFLTGQKASKLCKAKAGLHIYDKVEAEGLLGLYSIKNLSEFGLKYVEYELVTGEKFRKFIEDGEERKIKVENFQSEIEFIMEDKKVTSRIIISSKKLVSRSNGNVYSNFIAIVVYPGWADSLFINLTGTQYSGWSCGEVVSDISGETITFMDLIEATIVH